MCAYVCATLSLANELNQHIFTALERLSSLRLTREFTQDTNSSCNLLQLYFYQQQISVFLTASWLKLEVVLAILFAHTCSIHGYNQWYNTAMAHTHLHSVQEETSYKQCLKVLETQKLESRVAIQRTI